MQPNTLKLIAAALVGLSLALAVAGYRLSRSGAAATKTADAPQAPAHRAVIAVRDLSAGTTLKAVDLAVIAVPVVPDHAFTDSAPLVGRTVRRTVYKAELLRDSTFQAGSTLAQETAPGYRAVAVKVDETTGVGGFLQPGDRVDVFYAMRSSGGPAAQAMARRIVRDARILAFGTELAQRPSAAADTGGKRSRSAVLEVPPADASRLLLAETTGTLRLAAIGDREEHKSPRTSAPADSSDRISLADLRGSGGTPRREPRIEVFQGDQLQLITAQTRPQGASQHAF